MMSENSYPSAMREVAKILCGEPNSRLSTKTNWKYGTNGSLSIDIEKGVWKNWEDNDGGGVRDLIAKKIKGNEKDVSEWLKMHDIVIQTSDHKQQTQVVQPPQKKLIATYNYENTLGEIVYQVCRYELTDGSKKRKSFEQRRINENGEVIHNLKGVPRLPYNLVALSEAISLERPIFIVEGEKDVDLLWKKYNIAATTNSGGASNWPNELNGYFTGADVIIVPDNDEAGRKHAQDIALSLNGIASKIRLLQIPNLPEKGDVSDYFALGGTREEFDKYVETLAIPYSGEEIFRSKFGAIRWFDLDRPGLEHEWLIKNVLTRGERSMVAGPSQSGKSFAVLDMALCVARGTDYQAYAQIGGEGDFSLRSFKTRRGGVVYQAGEGGRGIKKRLRAYRKHHNLESNQNIPFVLLPQPVDLHSNEEQTKQLISEINHWAKTFDCPLELVVIDTLSAATPGANENSSEDVSRILARCERIAHMTGAHVMFVHHMNANGDKPRGHTSIFANLDNVLSVKRTEEKEPTIENKIGRDVREIILTKSKDGEDGTIIKFVLNSIPLGQDEDGEPITSCVCTPPRGVLTNQNATEKVITLNEKLFIGFKSFINAIDEFGIPAPESIEFAKRDIRVIKYSDFYKSFAQLSLDAEYEQDPIKKKKILTDLLAEVGRGLFAKGLIEKKDIYLWYTGRPVKGFAHKKMPSINQERNEEDIF